MNYKVLGRTGVKISELGLGTMNFAHGVDEEMAKKTVIKQALKYAPIKTDFQRALSTDCSIKKEISDDMFSVKNEVIENEVM